MACAASAGELEDELTRKAGVCNSITNVHTLANKGANLNAKDNAGQTALMKAVRMGNCNMEVVRFLIEKGADVNAYDKHGLTALIFAAHKGSMDTVRLLLDKGADVNAKGDWSFLETRWTPLFFAISETANVDIIRILIDKGADMNAKDGDGHTVLWHINSKIKKGRSGLNARGDVVYMPLPKAEKEAYEEIVRILERAGAR